ncbi:protein croquemort-like isoform X2 [Rhynchophorus ferrugineus]
MYHKKMIRNRLWICGSSVLFIVIGIILICLRSVMYKSIFSMLLTMEPGSFSFTMWRENPIPLTLQVYLYNWTNPEQLFNRTVKPHFKQLGPYVFDETKKKVNITWHKNDTVSYYYLKRWWFNEAKSTNNLTDLVTSIAPVKMTTATVAKDWNIFAKKSISFYLTSLGSKIYDTHAAGDILFNGYDDPIINLSHKLPMFAAPDLPGFDKFGWFYTRNDSRTYEGLFNMGVGRSTKLGELYAWKDMKQTPFYPGHCGKVEGSGGDFFQTNLKKDTVIKMFSPDMCRFIEFEFEKEEIVGGILGYKYSVGKRVLDNGTKITDRKCFNKDPNVRSGIVDISACRYGSPAYVSLPHFHKADPFYTTAIEGLQPDDDIHNFFMTFEPTTGIPLKVAARLQLNLKLQPIPSIRMYENAPTTYIPVLWFEQVAIVPGYMTFLLQVFLRLENLILGLGIFITMSAVLLQIYTCRKLYTTKVFEDPEIITREQVPLTLKNKEVEISR